MWFALSKKKYKNYPCSCALKRHEKSKRDDQVNQTLIWYFSQLFTSHFWPDELLMWCSCNPVCRCCRRSLPPTVNLLTNAPQCSAVAITFITNHTLIDTAYCVLMKCTNPDYFHYHYTLITRYAKLRGDWRADVCREEKVSWRLGHVLLSMLDRNTPQKRKKGKFKFKDTWMLFFLSVWLFVFRLRDCFHILFSPLQPLFSRSFLRSCLSCHVQRTTHTHRLAHTLSRGSGAIFGSWSAATNKEK